MKFGLKNKRAAANVRTRMPAFLNIPAVFMVLGLTLTRQGRVVGVVSQRASFEFNRGQLRRKVRQIDLDAHVGAQIDQILAEAMEAVDVSKDARLFDRLPDP